MQGQSLDSTRERNDDAAKTANPSINLVDLVMSDKAQTAPLNLREAVAAGAATSAGDATAKTCKTSPEYESRIDNVARRIFDPAALGDLQQLKSKYNCDIQRTGDPLRYVKLALDKDDNDPYTSYLTPTAYKSMLDSQKRKMILS
jgi:hypothetical protein